MSGYERTVTLAAPNGVVQTISAELGAGSGFALSLTHDEARALLASSPRWRYLNAALAAAVVRAERDEMHEIDAGDDVKITINVRRRK